MDCFLETLPQLKQAWLRTGNTQALMDGLRQLTAQGLDLGNSQVLAANIYFLVSAE